MLKDFSNITGWQWVIIVTVAVVGGFARYFAGGNDRKDDGNPTTLFPKDEDSNRPTT
jgi:hypothetical protein